MIGAPRQRRSSPRSAAYVDPICQTGRARGQRSQSCVQFPLLNNGNADYDTETYILIANTSASAGTATVTLYRRDGAPLSQTVPLSANSRVNVPVSVVF